MKGSIVENGVILGEDGNRYTYDKSQIKDLDPNLNLIGKKVIFLSKDGVVTEIFLENSPLEMIKSDDLSAIKLKSYGAIGCGVVSGLPYIGFIFSIASVVLRILATISVRNKSQSNTILFNLVFSLVSGAIAIFLGYIGVAMINAGGLLGALGALLVILGIAIVICGIISSYLYYKELAQITSQKHFTNAFWCYVAGVLLLIVVIGLIFLLAAIILEILAWKNTQSLAQSNGDYSKVKSIFSSVQEAIKNKKK